jgi:hypothetical protein
VMNPNQAVEFMSSAKSGGIGAMLDNPIGRNVSTLVKDWDIELNQEGAVLASLLITLSGLPSNNQVLQIDNTDSVKMKLRPDSENEEAVTLTEENPSDGDFPVESSWFGLLLTALPKARTWIYELAACHQVSRLSQGNIKNYFASQNGIQVQGKSILPVVNVAASTFPMITENEGLRVLLSDASFLRYHTTATSTPGLLSRVFENLGEMSSSVFPEGTKEAVDEALKMYWDSSATAKISTRAIGIGHAFLSATGALPENWYQGAKAKDTIMPTLYSGWVAFFKKFAMISVDMKSIEGSEELSSLMEQAPRIFSGQSSSKAQVAKDKGKMPIIHK